MADDRKINKPKEIGPFITTIGISVDDDHVYVGNSDSPGNECISVYRKSDQEFICNWKAPNMMNLIVDKEYIYVFVNDKSNRVFRIDVLDKKGCIIREIKETNYNPTKHIGIDDEFIYLGKSNEITRYRKDGKMDKSNFKFIIPFVNIIGLAVSSNLIYIINSNTFSVKAFLKNSDYSTKETINIRNIDGIDLYSELYFHDRYLFVSHTKNRRVDVLMELDHNTLKNIDKITRRNITALESFCADDFCLYGYHWKNPNKQNDKYVQIITR